MAQSGEKGRRGQLFGGIGISLFSQSGNRRFV